MLDINLLRKDLDAVLAGLNARKSPQAFLDLAAFTTLEAERKTIQTRTEELQARRNTPEQANRPAQSQRQLPQKWMP